MKLMKRLGMALSARQVLAFLVILLVGGAVWWIGPLLSFNGMRPLEGLGIRVAVIVLLLAAVLF